MKRFLIIVLIVAGACNLWAQKQLEKVTFVNAPVNIASEETRKSFTPPADFGLKSGSVLNSDFQVEFVNFPENAKSAFLYAISMYENLISSSVPITVEAKWENMGTNVLAFSAPGSMYKNFGGAQLANVYYPVALAEKLSGGEMNGTEADIVCSFNKNIDWYYGTNGNTPSKQYDFVTVVLHEIIHGLGFVGFYDVVNGKGTLNNSTKNPSIFDVYVYNEQTQQLSDNSTFVKPSDALKNALLSDELKITAVDKTETGKIYAPRSWNVGTSVYHLHETVYKSGDANSLMTPFIFKGEAIHHPGDKVLDLLAQFGWKSVSFDDFEIKDFENPCEKLPVFVQVGGELGIDNSSVKVTFSTDNFATSETVDLAYNASNQRFEGELPLNNAKGKVYYYFEAKTSDKQTFTYPEQAPERKLSFRIGPDYYPPILNHNPEKIVSSVHPIMDFTATASDNVGIESVTILLRINGADQEPFTLQNESEELYSGKLEFPVSITENDIIEYRVLAKDDTERGNKRFLPTQGYYQVEVFASQQPRMGYFSDFDAPNNDFEISDFEMTHPSGFSNGNLHTINPYPKSNLDNDKYNLIAQLKYPIIVEENGLMSFDEVVLVEPGEEGTIYTEDQFWDFVIVEGSKNDGKSWLPVTDGYDSGVDELWNSQFTGSLKSAVSQANGHENMFLKQTINLTEDTEFEAGDTVIFRFRLASDKAVTGWGWAIDNLSIQEVTTSADEIFASEDVSIYPNPFKKSIFVQGFKTDDFADVDIVVTDLYGKIVHRETRNDAGYSNKFRIDLPNVAPGVYMASITDNQSNSINQKIIKN